VNLIIDIGNTRVKVACFKGDDLVWQESLDSFNELNEKKLLAIKNVIISSVTDESQNNLILQKFSQAIILSENTNLPIQNLYKTPITLGKDRLANAVGAYRSFPNNNTLIIDAGTCLKFDFVSKNNEYLGGAISPGLKMRFKALHTFTAKLPLIDDYEKTDIIGVDTTTSILSGCVNGFRNEITETIHLYKERFENLKVIITGGDTSELEKMDFSQKNSIFADRWLTLRGLNEILKHNVEK
jgi:type III pantothenate kinase